MQKKREQTVNEESANAISHAIGIVFCLIAMPFLLKNALQKDTMTVFWAVLIFGVGMLMVYTSSTLYHLIYLKKYKTKLQIADHISIYFLIAGTYTPLVASFLPEKDAMKFLIFLWSFVAIGVIFKLFFTHRFKIVSVLLYLTMGWMIVFIIAPMKQNMPNDVLQWVIMGGLSYTIGVYFYVKSNKLYYHAIWHCFVLGGTVLHYIAVYKSI